MQKNNVDLMTLLRHTLHQNAELSLQESETIRILQDFLRDNTSLQIFPQDGWFYAWKPGTGTVAQERTQGQSCPPAAALPPVAFRADLDALPIPETIDLPYASGNDGVSHKCGHDGHCAALCGLALELSGLQTQRDVYLIFQPGEEIGAGALKCRELIREKGISEIYAFHNLGGFPEGALVYRPGLTQPASEGLRIRLSGVTSHASAPEKGNNPAGILSGIVLFAQSRFPVKTDPSRKQNAAEENRSQDAGSPAIPSAGMRLCTITGIRLGDGDFGISPGEGEICMTLRAEAEEDLKEMEGVLLSFAAEQAAGAGLRISHSIHDYFPETRNDPACLEKVLEAARRKKMPAIPMPEMWRASEDFGHYLKECPGAMFYIGNGESYAPLHTTAYDFNDRILECAAELFLELI